MENEVIKKNPNMKLKDDMIWINSNFREHSLLSTMHANASSKVIHEIRKEISDSIESMSPLDYSRAIRDIATSKAEKLNIPYVCFTQLEDTFNLGFTPGEYLDLVLYYTSQSILELAKQEGILLSDARGEKPVEDVYQEVEEHLMEEEIPDKIEKEVFNKIEREYEGKTRLEKDMRWVNEAISSRGLVEIDSKSYPLVCSTWLRDIYTFMMDETYLEKDSFDNDELAASIPAVDESKRYNNWLYRCVQTMTTLAQRLDVPIENADSTERRPLAEIFEDSKKAMKRKHLNVSDVLKDIKTRDESMRKDALSDAFSPDNELRSGITTEATKTIIADVLPEPEKEEEGKVEE